MPLSTPTLIPPIRRTLPDLYFHVISSPSLSISASGGTRRGRRCHLVLKTLLQLPTCCFIHQTYIIGRRMFTIESYSKVEKRCPSRPWCSNDPTRGSSNHDMLSTTTCIPGQSMQEPSNITQAVGYKAQQFLRCNAYLRRSSVITADYVRQAHRRPVTEQISFVESCCSHISSIIELLARNLRAWRHGVLNFPTSLCEHKKKGYRTYLGLSRSR